MKLSETTNIGNVTYCLAHRMYSTNGSSFMYSSVSERLVLIMPT